MNYFWSGLGWGVAATVVLHLLYGATLGWALAARGVTSGHHQRHPQSPTHRVGDGAP